MAENSIIILISLALTLAFLQFPAEKSFRLSDLDKIKVIDKLEVTDSESDLGLHGKALVSEIFAFYLNKIHFCYIFATSSIVVQQKSFN